MNTTRKFLATLLNSAIHGRSHTNEYFKCINLRALYKEASVHHVQTLLYPLIKNLISKDDFAYSDVISEWKKVTILNGIIQTKHIKQISKVMEEFSKANVKVIALKGLVMKEYYPNPELRTMIDADILVHKRDVEVAKELLLTMGYNQDNITPMHIHFTHGSYLTIELHWMLSDERYLVNVHNFENTIWDNALPYKICNAICYKLSLENQAVHLLLHMATHMVSSGFGLRQLCDLVLFLESERNNIDWILLNEKLKICNIERFANYIYKVCHNLFDMDLSEEYVSEKDRYYLDLFINDILCGGVYGKRNLALMYGNELAQYASVKNVGGRFGKAKSIWSILFPSIERLASRYIYVKKFVVLVPFAWMHHLLSGLFNKNFDLIDKVKFLLSTNIISRKRAKLLQWLKLQ